MSATAAWAQVQPRLTEAINSTHRIILAGNVHPLARAEFDRGATGGGQPMTRMLLLLKRSNAQEAALAALLEQQHDKNSPNYHAWLNPENFGATYGPADADIQAMTDWLSSQGFVVNKVYSGKTIIEFSGNAGQVQQTFGTEIHKYEVDGKSYLANAQDPQIPAALAPVVAGIVSLNNFPRVSHARVVGVVQKIPGQTGLQPLFTFPFQNGTFYGLGPGDFATIYNSKSLAASGNDGTGQTIAVVGETNINVQDVANFRAMFGLPATFTAANVILNGEDPGITSPGEETEADLDVQWSGAVAPGATVKLVVSASTPASAGIDLSALYIIEHNLAGVMSESYGSCEPSLGSAGNAFYNSLWEQAAAQGITAVLSSGDGGSAGCDDFNTASVAANGLAVSGLAATPYNVSVGGTDFDQRRNPALYWSASNSTTGTSALGYIPEIPWNQNCAQIGLTGCGSGAPQGSVNIVAGSGGPSGVYPKPSWQLGVTGMPNDNHRDQPDVSLFASAGFSGTGYIVCQQDQSSLCDLNGGADFILVGGTSAAAPAFAGTMALVNQYEGAHGGTNRQGNANYTLYALAKKSGASCASSTTEAAGCVFNDITKGSSDLPTGGVGIGTNSVPCKGGTPNCSVAVATATGVLVNPPLSSTEAWTAASGYDMATGLGSVNIGNLATKWNTVSTVATATTLTLTPLTGITHGTGENVTVNVSVTPTSGTASGDVSLIANINGATQGLDQFTLASGSISGKMTQSLPGGSYSVYAHYAGDGTNAPSDSTPVNVTVAKESSQTFIVIPTFDASGNQLSGNASSAPYGSNYIIRMYVADKNAVGSPTGPPSPACYQENALTCPSGSVSLTANNANVDAGTYALNSAGYTRDIAPTLTGGTYPLVAKYAGDNSYQPSASATTTFTITPAATQTQLGYVPPSAIIGQALTLTATVGASVSSNSAVPAGTVTFYSGNAPLPGTVSVSASPGSSIAYLNTALANQGTQSITAKYGGDSNYGSSTSSSLTINALFPTTITQSESSNNINLGQSITVTAVVKSNLKSPPLTGQVQFNGPYSFTGITTTQGTDANGNQILTATATTAPQATESIGVIYEGDNNYGQSYTNGDLVTVNIPDFTLPASATINVTAGQTGTATIQVTPLSNVPSTVNLSDFGIVPGGMTLTISPTTVNLNGAAVPVTLTLTTTGTNGVQSNSRVMQMKKAGFFVIRKPTWWSTSLLCLIFAIYLFAIRGRKKRFRAAFFVLMLGAVSFSLGCGGGGSSGGSGNGGGGNGGGGTGPFATTTTVSTSAAKVAQGSSVTFTATVSGKGNPTGSVLFLLNNNFQSTAPLVAGTATLTTTSDTTVGTYSLTAQYLGDSQNINSTSNPITEVITGSTTIQLMGNTTLLNHQTNLIVNLQ